MWRCSTYPSNTLTNDASWVADVMSAASGTLLEGRSTGRAAKTARDAIEAAFRAVAGLDEETLPVIRLLDALHESASLLNRGKQRFALVPFEYFAACASARVSARLFKRWKTFEPVALRAAKARALWCKKKTTPWWPLFLDLLIEAGVVLSPKDSDPVETKRWRAKKIGSLKRFAGRHKKRMQRIFELNLDA
jgi:hypothetical protein